MPGRGLCMDYFQLMCTFDNMTKCINISSNMNDYAMLEFEKQVHFGDLKVGLEHLGLGFTKWTAIETLGLPTVPSQANKTTELVRMNLGFMYEDMQYYEHKTRPLRDDAIYERIYPKAIYGLNKDLTSNMNAINQAVQGQT
jgi:hypothetical protein